MLQERVVALSRGDAPMMASPKIRVEPKSLHRLAIFACIEASFYSARTNCSCSARRAGANFLFTCLSSQSNVFLEIPIDGQVISSSTRALLHDTERNGVPGFVFGKCLLSAMLSNFMMQIR